MDKFHCLIFILLTGSVSAEPPKEISLSDASKLGFRFEVENQFPDCSYILIRAPETHPTLPGLTKASFTVLVEDKNEPVYISHLSVGAEVTDETVTHQSYVCLPNKGTHQISVQISYEKDWEEICRGKETCDIYTICRLSWSITGIEKLIKKT